MKNQRLEKSGFPEIFTIFSSLGEQQIGELSNFEFFAMTFLRRSVAPCSKTQMHPESGAFVVLFTLCAVRYNLLSLCHRRFCQQDATFPPLFPNCQRNLPLRDVKSSIILFYHLFGLTFEVDKAIYMWRTTRRIWRRVIRNFQI